MSEITHNNQKQTQQSSEAEANELISDGYSRCKICKSKTILISACYLWEPDDEPYKHGKQVELDTVELNQNVSGPYCPNCKMLLSVNIS